MAGRRARAVDLRRAARPVEIERRPRRLRLDVRCRHRARDGAVGLVPSGVAPASFPLNTKLYAVWCPPMWSIHGARSDGVPSRVEIAEAQAGARDETDGKVRTAEHSRTRERPFEARARRGRQRVAERERRRDDRRAPAAPTRRLTASGRGHAGRARNGRARDGRRCAPAAIDERDACGKSDEPSVRMSSHDRGTMAFLSASCSAGREGSRSGVGARSGAVRGAHPNNLARISVRTDARTLWGARAWRRA